MTAACAGYLHEVFRSIQGEGPYVGVAQVFVRFSGCSRRCRYCDSMEARSRSGSCRLRLGDGILTLPNPVPLSDLVRSVRELAAAAGLHSVSLTGGEPLEQPDFCAALALECKRNGYRVYLETNGLPLDGAREVAPLADIVSLDIKLPSLCPGVSLDRYGEVLPLFSRGRLFCKIVVAEGFSMEDLREACRLVAGHDRATTLVVQPATPVPGCATVGPRRLLECQTAASDFLDDVRVIPQCHKLMGLR